METKVKNYTIMLSQVFPTTHTRAGEPTQFIEEFIRGRGCSFCPNNPWCDPEKEGCVAPFKKIHTIRANYPLWKKRIEAVQRGEAVINIRVWNGKPYRSKTTLIHTLTAKDGVGIQKLTFSCADLDSTCYIDDKSYAPYTGGVDEMCRLANNDGLCYVDWAEWFKGYDLSQPLAIIHFTNFRY